MNLLSVSGHQNIKIITLFKNNQKNPKRTENFNLEKKKKKTHLLQERTSDHQISELDGERTGSHESATRGDFRERNPANSGPERGRSRPKP